MKSTLIVIAIALASGLLVASGAGAQSHRQIDVLGPEYNDLDLRGASSAEKAETGEMVPAGSSEGVDILGPDYNRGIFP